MSESDVVAPHPPVDPSDDEITRRLDAVYSEQDSHLDGLLAAAQAEAVREEW